MLNQAPHPEGACGSGDTAPRILIFGTTKKAVVSLGLNRFTPRGKIPRHPETQSRS